MAFNTDSYPDQKLNGFPLSILALTKETVTRLRALNIFALEQLAYVALINPPELRDEVLGLLQRDLSSRLQLPSLTCYVRQADEHRQPFKLIIESDLFAFTASAKSQDDPNPTCMYMWNNPEYNRSTPFHIPQKVKRSRRKNKNSVINTELQPELPLFDVESCSPIPDEDSLSASERPSATDNMSLTEPTLQLSISSDARSLDPVTERHETVAEPVCEGNDMRNRLASNVYSKTLREEPMPVLTSNYHDSYDIWNDKLITYFTAGIPRGTRVFLSIDDDGIADLKDQMKEPVEDFYQAVRDRVVVNNKVCLKFIQGRNEDEKPKGVAFLAVMVIAASYMVDEEEYSQTNYFVRLREVLGLPVDTGRPPGMDGKDIGKEELLWQEWTSWLMEQGFLPSARRGKSRADKFIYYPLSQALLRHTDKDRLCRLFDDRNWNRDWDSETLGAYIRREKDNLSNHLREILNDASRYHAIISDMYDLYEDWRNGNYDFQSIRRTIQRRYLMAGIYRTEDITGKITYYLYPRSPRRQQIDELQVSIADRVVTLRNERQGWYMPQHRLSKEEIERGMACDILQPPHLEKLHLPQQPFWILVPDPDNPESGVYASWGRPTLGTYFIIVCRNDLVSQLEHLRDERLIEWDDKPYPSDVLTNWVEIRHCTVISPAWDGVEISNQDLYEKLCPRDSLNISFSGGIRAPGDSGWIEDYGPQITIYGFESEVDVVIKQAKSEDIIFEETRPTNEPFPFSWPRDGDYIVELPASGFERLVTIRKWKDLEITQPSSFEKTLVNDWSICGALIEE